MDGVTFDLGNTSHPKGQIDAYLKQWLTSTGGKVSYIRSLYQNRLQFICNACEASLTLSEGSVSPDGIDYTLQQFVQIHSHLGGHVGVGQVTSIDAAKKAGDYKTSGAYPKQSSTAGSVDGVPCQIHGGDEPTPVTLDFKKVKTANLKISTGRKFR